MTKMSLSHDEAGAADRQPFVWCRGRMDRTACLGRGLRPARPGLDGQAAGWQGSCRPPTGSGAAARKGWAARSPGGEPARLGPRAGLEAQTGTVTRPPPSPGRTGEQVGSLGRGLVLRGRGRRRWAREGVLPPRLALPVVQTLSLEKKTQEPTFLICGQQRARRWPGPGAHARPAAGAPSAGAPAAGR